MAPYSAPQRPALTADFFTPTLLPTPTPTQDAIPVGVRTSPAAESFATSIATSFSTTIPSSTTTPPALAAAAAATTIPFPQPFAPIVRPVEAKPFFNMSMMLMLFGVIFFGTILGKMYYELFFVDNCDEAKQLWWDKEEAMEIELKDMGDKKGMKEISI